MAVDPTSKVYFYTPMLRLSDMKYPVYLTDFLQEYTNVSIGSFVWEYEMRDNYGYCMVHDSEVPEADVVTEGFPEYNEEDELWYKTWISRDFTPEEIADRLEQSKTSHRLQAYQVYTNDLLQGITVSGSTFSIEPVELSNLYLTQEYAKSNPDSTVLIRKSDYTSLELPAQEALDKISEILTAAGEVNQRQLRYVNTVLTATDADAIPEVPVTFVGE